MKTNHSAVSQIWPNLSESRPAWQFRERGRRLSPEMALLPARGWSILRAVASPPPVLTTCLSAPRRRGARCWLQVVGYKWLEMVTEFQINVPNNVEQIGLSGVLAGVDPGGWLICCHVRLVRATSRG